MVSVQCHSHIPKNDPQTHTHNVFFYHFLKFWYRASFDEVYSFVCIHSVPVVQNVTHARGRVHEPHVILPTEWSRQKTGIKKHDKFDPCSHGKSLK